MKKIILGLSLLTFFACNNSSKNSESQSDSNYIVENLLSINSETELAEKFGKENITRRDFTYGERTEISTESVLFEGTEKEIQFAWKDDSVNFNKLNIITVSKPNSVWKTREGIKIGTRMTELEKINGKPFTFSGFGSGDAGQTDFDGGVLSPTPVYFTLGGLKQDYNNEKYTKLISDKDFKSDSKEALDYNPYVVEFCVIKK